LISNLVPIVSSDVKLIINKKIELNPDLAKVVVLGGFRHVLGDGDLDEVEERGACHSQEEDQHQVGIIADLEKNNMRISLLI
jgi:hypothetical protein